MPSRRLLDVAADTVDVDSMLSPAERHRQALLAHPGDRQDFVAARLLTRWLLTRLAGAPSRRDGAVDEWSGKSLAGFRIGQRCEQCGGPHGRPFVDLPGVGVSWAHAGGHVASAVGHGEVGVDVEPLGGRPGAAQWTGDRQSGREQSLVSWVRGEAVVKQGHGQLDLVAQWSLGSPPAPGGRRYWIPVGGAPRPRRPLTLGRVASVVITDLTTTGAWPVVCSVAATRPARLELPQIP